MARRREDVGSERFRRRPSAREHNSQVKRKSQPDRGASGSEPALGTKGSR